MYSGERISREKRRYKYFSQKKYNVFDEDILLRKIKKSVSLILDKFYLLNLN